MSQSANKDVLFAFNASTREVGLRSAVLNFYRRAKSAQEKTKMAFQKKNKDPPQFPSRHTAISSFT